MPIIDPYEKKTSSIIDPYKVQRPATSGPSLASMLYRPALEYGGMAVGGLLGTPAGPGGNVVGAGLGYGIGKGVADIIEGKQPQTLNAALAKSGKDVLSGASMEAGGAILGRGIQAGGKALAESGLAERLYSSSIKMPLSQKWVKARGPEGTSNVKMAVKKGLDERIPPSEYGLELTKAGKMEAGKAIDREVASMTESYPINDILKNGLQKSIQKAIKGEAPMKDISRVKAYAEDLKAGRSPELSAAELNDLKKELYQLADYDKLYGKADSLVETMRKGVAHEIRMRLQASNPALQSANVNHAQWKLLEEAIERSLARRNNRDIIDLGTKVLIGKETMPMAFLNATIGHPAVKSRIAFIVKDASKLTGGKIARPVGYLTGGWSDQ